MRNLNNSNRDPITVDRATAALPQTADGSLFTVVGKVRLLEIIGEVTTVIETKDNNTKIKFNPTTGADVDMCAVLNITADAVGTLYTITGDFADAMQDGIGALDVDALMEKRGNILQDGVIELDCAASNTGSVQWSVQYEPISAGAYIVPA